jgi:hypothetical protein
MFLGSAALKYETPKENKHALRRACIKGSAGLGAGRVSGKESSSQKD